MIRKNRSRVDRRASIETLELRRLLTTYYVDNKLGDNGADTNNGTALTTPFLTIQKAASIALPGDTVDIRAGTYREEVIPAHSGTSTAPITYQPYNNENVVVSGADIVGGWSSYNGSIYQSSAMNWTMGGQDDQLFVDGQMMNYARWPNTSLDLSHPNWSIAGLNTTGTYTSNDVITNQIYDPNLTQPSGYWTGATIHVESGQTWIYEAATITNYQLTVVNGISYGVITYTSSFTDPGYYIAQAGDPYYITGDPYFTGGSFQTLSAASQFYRDPNSGKVYLWTPAGDSPAGHLIEAKHREYAFDLSGDSYINISGINLFAAGINSSATSGHITINGITAQYVSHFETYNGNWTPTLLNGTPIIGGTGIVLDGGYDTIENSTIAYSAGEGVYLGGSNNTVYNNVIHDVDYSGLNCAGVSTSEASSTLSTNNSISYNTIFNSGRALIEASGITASRINNNLLWNAMLQTDDGGAIYAFSGNGNGTEIDHNIISNVVDNIFGFPACGIFMDGYSTGFTLDHNVIYNAIEGIKEYLTYNINLINNTIVNTGTPIDISSYTATGAVVNNITMTAISLPFGPQTMTISNNLQAPPDPLFVAPASGNYQLQAGSPAIDAGTPAAPYTNGYAGSAPDIGAYESGVAPWSAGSALSSASADALPPALTAGDIGSPTISGSAAFANGVYTVSGSGTDIWYGADQFQYVDAPVTGDQVFITSVASQINTNTWAKSGIMFRSSLSASSPFFMVAQTPGNGINLFWRDGSGNLGFYPSGAIGNPAWLELVRSGDVFSGYDSVDGVNWNLIASITIPLPSAGFIGLAVCSHDPTVISTATFDNVSLQLPAASALTASASSSSAINLNWTAASGASGYVIQRSTDGVNFANIATVGAVTTYTDSSNISGGTQYYYRVVSASPFGSSGANSNVASATTLLAPPTALTASANSSAISLTWNASAGAVTYNIYRGTSAGGESTIPLATGLTAASYTDTTAVAGTPYYYDVTAVNASGPSGVSNEVSVTEFVKLTGAPIGVGGAYAANSGVAAAFDGSLTTFFDPANGALTNWAGLDLLVPQTISQIRFAPRAGYEYRMVGGQFQVSSTPDFSSNVVTLYTIKSAPVAGQFTTISVNPGGLYRFVRYVGGTQWVNIAEMEVDGIPSAAPTIVKLTGAAIGVGGAYSANTGVTAAFDSSFSTFFDPATGSLSNWVGLDMQTPQTIAQIKFAPRAGYEYRMVGGQFQASSTPDFSSNVVTLYTITSVPLAGQFTTVMVSAPTQYRYVRYTGGTQWVNIAEMEVDGIASAVPVSSKLSGTAIGTAGYTSTSGDAAAFDGSFSTYFDAADSSLNDWVGLDLGTARTITQIKFAPRTGEEFRMYGGQFQVSNSANFSSGVVTIYTVSAIPTAGQFTTAAVSAPGTYRYIRYTGGTQWVNVAEIEVDGY